MSGAVIKMFGGAYDYYLKDCDFEAQGGRGKVLWTTKLTDAKRFPTTIEAFNYYRRQSATVPTRDDGKPNCPLTAYTVQIQRL